MVNLEDARRAADHLRAKAETERSGPAALLVLLAGAVVAARMPDDAGLLRHGGLLVFLAVGPFLVARMLPKGNLMSFRLSLATYPFSVVLLALIAWLEASRIPPFQMEDVPQVRWLFPALAMAVPVFYAVIQFASWIRRVQLYPEIRRALAAAPPAQALGEVAALVAQATSTEPPMDAPWAEFRTVPARPGNWRAFLKLDTEEHGAWRVAFADGWAIVVFKDGRRCEAVLRGGIRVVVDDDARPGSRHQMCLLRWNAHLNEGRITQGDFQKILAWNTAA
jgi:hypothetical protein